MRRVLCSVLAVTMLMAPLAGVAELPVAQANQKVFRKVTPEDNKRAAQFLEQANQLRAAGDYEQAITLYTKAIHINERLGGYAGRAYCRFLLGDYEQAERDANTSIYNRSASDLLLPGMMGMAEYVRGVCRYRRGQFAEAEADLRAASSSRYGTDEVKQMYHDCRQKAAVAKEKAAVAKVQEQFADADNTIREALQTGKIKAYDLSRGDSWWRSDRDRQDFENTMQRNAPVEAASVLQDFTKYLWVKGSLDGDYVDIVAFVPRHTAITGGDGTIYRDKVILVQVSSVPRNIKLVSELPPSATLYDTHMVERGGLAQIVHTGDSDGYTWESLAQEEVRKQQEASYGMTVRMGIPDDYTIVPTSNPWVYKLAHADGERVYWLSRIDVALPALP
ncbi:hypothetical protein SAMN04487861_13415 [Selenomonas ruminantium]|uniref:Uncharacterized protein n=1 Tax=Selenomonas ruminantium TaxID=971 RepID=A0A1I3HUT7_SELRU|nr:hypothetical protein [Selenomonas ruminantium]MBQ1889653.1 hypothetical protein [Selenomonas sp.]SFI39422.1 hypothetical protein SAMN04487861_13415 [Selenomonas ruminantium]